MTKGQRIAESLRVPARMDMVALHWLLLFTISSNPGIKLRKIKENLKILWEQIHEKNPHFYIFWGGYSDGHKWQHREMMY
jgi:hypothetical protein